jgi:hypothetical protein
MSIRDRTAPQTVRHALEHPGGIGHPRPALRRSQRPMEQDHLDEHQHSDKRGLTQRPTNLSHTQPPEIPIFTRIRALTPDHFVYAL